MKSRFITDLQDAPDSFFDTAGSEVYTIFFPSAESIDGANPIANIPLEILPTSLFSSQTATSTGGQSVPNSVVAVTSGGIIINLFFDAAAMAAPASFRAG